jgi:hypothetical protein
VVLGIPWVKEYKRSINWQTEKTTLVEEEKNRKVNDEGPLNIEKKTHYVKNQSKRKRVRSVNLYLLRNIKCCHRSYTIS